MPDRQRAMSWSTFERIYKPLTDQPIEHVDIPKGTEVHTIWTLVDAEGQLQLVPGWHIVNRLGYYITEKPWIEGDDLWVRW